jgi:hypothetical protein
MTVANCAGFFLTGGAPRESFRSMLKLDSLGPSTAAVESSTAGFGFTGGGVRVRILCNGSMSLGSSSCGSGGRLKARRGLGERTAGGARCEMCRGVPDRFGGGVIGRFCSNMFTREVVGGIGVSSTALCSSTGARTVLAIGAAPLLFALFGRGRACAGAVGRAESSLARTSPTLPAGGSMSRSVLSRSLIILRSLMAEIGEA